ncbi:hypothetical protein FRC17_002165 [Serendipita sp. 399]|nr:hypothetical protein FRC17_002165 [Serendipita sp. 399]
MKRLAAIIGLHSVPQSMHNLDLMSLGVPSEVGPSWLDFTIDPWCTQPSRAYTSRYSSRPKPETSRHTDFVNTLNPVTEPGFALGPIPIQTLGQAFSILSVVKEQLWLRGMILGAGFQPGFDANQAGLTSSDVDRKMGEDDADKDAAKALYESLLNNTYVPTRLRATYDVLEDGRTGIRISFPLGGRVVLVEVVLDFGCATGVQVTVNDERIESLEEVVRRAHGEFRYPELQSISELFNFDIRLPEKKDELDVSLPFLIVELEKEVHAQYIAQRAVYELWVVASSKEELHSRNHKISALWRPFENDSFRFDVTAINHTIPMARQHEVIEDFAYMDYKGNIEMKNPSVVLAYFEEYPRKNILRRRNEGDGKYERVYFGRLVAESACRHLISKFNVKKRVYYGNTTMDAEISLLMANQALVCDSLRVESLYLPPRLRKASSGKLVYDPFVGTGSMLYVSSVMVLRSYLNLRQTSAYFGAMVLGSDIDGRQMRGKNLDTPGIFRSASQYGVLDRILDCCTFDITRSPLRRGNFLDAIISDPPYGVRAGAKRLGRAKRDGELPSVQMAELTASFAKVPYELSDLTADLVLLARYLLKEGGRLVWFLPTPTEEYQDVDIPVCEGMEVVANSVQNFGKWGRRLITMRKTTSTEYAPPSFDPEQRLQELGSQVTQNPGHKDFREKYFARFKRIDGSET